MVGSILYSHRSKAAGPRRWFQRHQAIPARMLHERSTEPVSGCISAREQRFAVELAEGNGRNLQDGFRSPHLHDSRQVLIQLGTIIRFDALLEPLAVYRSPRDCPKCSSALWVFQSSHLRFSAREIDDEVPKSLMLFPSADFYFDLLEVIIFWCDLEIAACAARSQQVAALPRTLHQQSFNLVSSKVEISSPFQQLRRTQRFTGQDTLGNSACQDCYRPVGEMKY